MMSIDAMKLIINILPGYYYYYSMTYLGTSPPGSGFVVRSSDLLFDMDGGSMRPS